MAIIARLTDARFVQAVARFFQDPEIRDNLAFLAHRLPDSAEIFVAGGALRNIIIEVLHGKSPPTRDIDLFIGGLDRSFSLPKILEGQAAEPTDLKGMRWYPATSGMVYDLCLLPDFLVIEAYHLDPTLKNLLDSVDFTINAIVYDLRRQKLIEKGCTAAVRQRLIDFNSRLIPDKRLIAYRILLMAHKTGFDLALPVFQFVKQRLELETLNDLKRLLRAKTGGATAAAVMGEYDDLCRYPTHEAYLAARRRGN